METTQTAVTSPAMEVERGPLVNLTSDQRAEFRRTGELPEPPKQEQPKTEETASSDTGKDQASAAEEATTAGESETPKKPQESNRRKPDAEQRIGQLTSENKRLKQELETLKTAKPGPKAETKPAETQTAPAQPQPTRPKPAIEDKDKDGKPKYATYEDFVEDLSDWKVEQRMAAQQRDQQQQTQKQRIESAITEGKAIYGEDFGKIADETAGVIGQDAEIPLIIKQRIGRSDILPHLVYTLGNDSAELASFVKLAKSDQFKALDLIALTESLIREELAGKQQTETKTETQPAKPKTSAPPPPAEVGGRAATPGDQLEAAAKASDFRSFKAEANRRAIARLKG